MAKIDYSGSVLEIGPKTFDLDDKISKVVDVDGRYIVLFQYDSLSVEDENRNIKAYSKDGDVLWTVEKSPQVEDGGNPFTGIGITEEGLIGYTWHGLGVIIDVSTGEWKPYAFTK